MTRSRPDGPERRGARTLARLGVLAAAAIVVYVFESLLPSPLPWVRLGLSNAVVTVALFAYGFREAFVVNLARIVAGNLALGLLASPALIFSAAGSLSALVVMAAVRRTLVPPLSVVGASSLGAVANNAAQVAVFAAAFAPSAAVGPLLGTLVLAGVVVGLATGFVAAAILRKVSLAGVQGVN